jgi:hypothetical protein
MYQYSCRRASRLIQRPLFCGPGRCYAAVVGGLSTERCERLMSRQSPLRVLVRLDILLLTILKRTCSPAQIQ